ncbi:FlgO family outer membrane protein [Aestuariibacter sp. AA17]|uniref:FlgO family outer membrane protein n=1 Tax=Fluctibacter corallii TaxID=2984329 RepID=A0ABT3A381_9ALTE|nr:FlgO family outer membrane protein [Aestuariibacter sp. AA17]MCV2883085.1 FlgO family outer membrane protein [Aestuariibacter sp. AA17]
MGIRHQNVNSAAWGGWALACLIILSGCSSSSTWLSSSEPAPVQQDNVLGNIEFYTAQLADELFSGMPVSSQYRFAVAGFVPVSTMKVDLNHQHPLMLLGHQLEQGLITEAARRGMVAQDYKMANDIIMNADSDRVFSRQLDHLKGGEDVDFFVSGTITEQQEGAVVNARVIHVRSKDVVAAATKFFPATVFWQREKVTTRNGMIYRTGS